MSDCVTGGRWNFVMIREFLLLTSSTFDFAGRGRKLVHPVGVQGVKVQA